MLSVVLAMSFSQGDVSNEQLKMHKNAPAQLVHKSYKAEDINSLNLLVYNDSQLIALDFFSDGTIMLGYAPLNES